MSLKWYSLALHTAWHFMLATINVVKLHQIAHSTRYLVALQSTACSMTGASVGLQCDYPLYTAIHGLGERILAARAARE